MKIALAQLDIIPGRPDLNIVKMLDCIAQAKAKKVDVICLSELCVSGYMLGDKFTDENYCDYLMSFNDQILKASDGICVIWGNLYIDHILCSVWHPNKDGRSRKYNAAYIAQNGQYCARGIGDNSLSCLPIGVQPKTLLPNYRFFDDERYFLSFADFCLDYDVKLEDAIVPFKVWSNSDNCFMKIGIEVCEDLWSTDYRYKGEALNPTRFLIQNGAEHIFNLSASPWTYGKSQARDNRIAEIKADVEKFNLSFKPFYYINATGVQNNGKNIITFDGDTTAYNSDAKVIAFAEQPYEEKMLEIDTNEKYAEIPHTISTSSKIEQKYKAIIRGLRSMKDMMGLNEDPKWVIGLSGGVDSAVVASLLTIAFGKDKVIAINMPTKYNSSKTRKAAKEIAKKLGIVYKIIRISNLVKHTTNAISMIAPKGTDLNLENEQARLRGGTILAGVAAREKALFTNNGNKLEIALGYATLYGDCNGAICPIGDLTKKEVFELAVYLNEKVFGEEVIPRKLIPDELAIFKKGQIAPSAELKNNQIDPMKFFYHDAMLEAIMDYKKKSMEDFMTWWLEGTLHTNLNISIDLLKRWNIIDANVFLKDLEWFFKLLQKNIFKRIQTGPIILLSKSCWGFDHRESQLPFIKTTKVLELEEKVRAKGFYS